MHQALYRKWRPQTFDDVCGQEHITSILKYETEHNKFSHAYLFCGSRGTGKTTCAKILAKAVNCESPVNGSPCNKCASCLAIDSGAATDVLEMDAASNNGVDNIRDIRDEVVYMPTSLKYRVYIVDEVHMLSGSAFNALLKTLEEPPAHVVFVLATTELHKLPTTIISRCQRFDFRRISTEVLMDRLSYIAENEGIKYQKDALRVIAKIAQGGMRDAISLLELCAGTRNEVDLAVVNETLGAGDRDSIDNTVRAIARGNYDAIFATVNDVVNSSKDITVFWEDLAAYYRDMLVMKTTASAQRYLDLTENESEQLKATCSLFTKETLLWHCKVIDEAYHIMKKSGGAKRTVAEMALIRICDGTLDNSVDALSSRISKLENALASGVYKSAAAVDSNETKAKESTDTKAPKNEEAVAETKPSELQKADTGKCELKTLRGWYEIAEKAAAGDASLGAFLKMAKAFVDEDGNIYVKYPNDFVKTMVESAHAEDAILAAIRLVLKNDISRDKLIFGMLDGDESGDEFEDMII
ncbi:MAG: DNA polymerase III subunit gamma/tau [Ruminococcaceae bacterium]|nr:DNA polymerase III subunit gamma/tau [Oscillospiraceae bacterium]